MNKLTYTHAQELLQKKRLDSSILMDAQDALVDSPTKIVANLFVQAQAKLRDHERSKEQHLPQDVQAAVEDYLNALEAFENGTLGTHAKKGGLADLL